MSDLVAYVDGSCLGSPGQAGIGVIITGWQEEPIRVAKWIGHQDNNVAEYVALLEVVKKTFAIPQLVDTHRAAEILGRSPATLKRWRYEGVGPDWIELEGRVSYDVKVLLEYIQRNTRV